MGKRQTDAAPVLKPAVEVWREASDAATYGSVKYQPHADQAAAAVIEADRAAIIAAKDAEIERLHALAKANNQLARHEGLGRREALANLADARDRLAALQAHADAMEEVLTECRAQFDFYASEHRKAEKHDKAATNERFAFMCSQPLRAYEEFRRG